MKKQGVLHAQLAGLIAALGHMDLFLVGDAGMPIPSGVPIVDLALCGGVPSFIQTIDAILEETEIEGYVLAEEIKENNLFLLSYIQKKLPDADCQMIPHAELKELTKHVKFAVRTGEFTPYPNIILRAGVVF